MKTRTLHKIGLDVFLHCTLGGFAPDDGRMVNDHYHSLRLRNELRKLAFQRHVERGDVVILAERFGRSAASLRVTISHIRHRRAAA